MTTPTRPRDPGGGGGRIALAVGAGFVGLIALALLIGGLALLVIDRTQRDDDGFFTVPEATLAAPGRALVSGDLDLGTDPGHWFTSGLVATVRLEVEATTEAPVFVGIGHSDDVAEYLAGVAHAEVVEIGPDSDDVTYRMRSGETIPEPPANSDIWVATSQGEGVQELTWELESGEWTAVVMNADRSEGVSVEASAGVSTDLLFPIGLGLLAGSVVTMGGAALLLYLVVRRPAPARRTESETPNPNREEATVS